MELSRSSILRFIGYIKAGFPSPASDYMEDDIDLKSFLQPNPTSTFIARAVGDSMVNSNIPNGALLVIDKSLKPHNNSIVIASVNGENTVKHFVKTHKGIFLAPGNAAYKVMEITPDIDFAIWGVVTHIIIQTKK